MNYIEHKKKPSAAFLAAWASFYLWWLSFSFLPEFSLAVVPFFHSLQYLLFAYKVEASSIKNKNAYGLMLSLKVLLWMAVGFMSFELIPDLLDSHFRTYAYKINLFFIILIPVFINIHHFFIDSVAWRMKDPSVRDGIGL